MSIRDARAIEILSVASCATGLRAIPRLAESEMLSVPLMMGVREPAILLPAGWRRWDDEEFAAVLAHELSHVERRDALWQRLALIHRAIFWFSPLAWWLERHLADLSEQASDEAALAGGADRTRYAETLLGFFAELESAGTRVVARCRDGQSRTSGKKGRANSLVEECDVEQADEGSRDMAGHMCGAGCRAHGVPASLLFQLAGAANSCASSSAAAETRAPCQSERKLRA